MEISRERLALFGGAGLLGGAGGWAAGEPFLGIEKSFMWIPEADLRVLLFGAAVGAFIGVFVGAIEGLSAGHRSQTWQGMKLGAAAGLAGGGVGLLLGDHAFIALGGVSGRVVGWMAFGLIAGLGVGWIGRSPARLRNGALGGLLGGAVGGTLYEALTGLVPQQAAGRALAASLLGAAIGFFIGLVSEIFKRGWLMVIRSRSRNAREGREYPLIKARTTIGRAEECDVGLFGDGSVSTVHAVVEKRKGRFYIQRGEGGVAVNRAPAYEPVELRDGDRVEVGGTLFLFRERAPS